MTSRSLPARPPAAPARNASERSAGRIGTLPSSLVIAYVPLAVGNVSPAFKSSDWAAAVCVRKGAAQIATASRQDRYFHMVCLVPVEDGAGERLSKLETASRNKSIM